MSEAFALPTSSAPARARSAIASFVIGFLLGGPLPSLVEALPPGFVPLGSKTHGQSEFHSSPESRLPSWNSAGTKRSFSVLKSKEWNMRFIGNLRHAGRVSLYRA